MTDDRGQFQTQATVGGQQGITRHFWSHVTIA
jgi:hypothetical protein